jgi:PAS domain S-box-containing protein
MELSLLEGLDVMSSGFAMLGAEGQIRYVNRAASAMLGYLPEDLVGRDFRELLDEADRVAFEEERERRRLGATDPYPLTMLGLGGTPLPTRIHPTPLFSTERAFLGSFKLILPDSSVSRSASRTSGTIDALDRLMVQARALFASASSLRSEWSSGHRPLPAHAACGSIPGLDALSVREVEIFESLLSGQKPQAIAEARDISVHTVRNHIKAIYRKLGVRSQLELFGRFRSWQPGSDDLDR